MVLRPIGHAANTDEHKPRCHDEHGRNGDESPCPAVHDHREHEPGREEEDEAGGKDGEEEAPVEGRAVWDRDGSELRELLCELFGCITAMGNMSGGDLNREM